MKKIVITGMSGVGKTAILKHYENQGHHIIDCDQDGFIDYDEFAMDYCLNIEKILPILKKNYTKHLFISVTTLNQGLIYKYIDTVILLEAPLEVMKSRILKRENPYGKSEFEWNKIVEDTKLALPLLRESADFIVSTNAELKQVISEIDSVLKKLNK